MAGAAGAADPRSSSRIGGGGIGSSSSADAFGSTARSLGQASPRTLVFETLVVSLATAITQIPRPAMSSALIPTMNSVKRSWYRLLIKRFFQLRL
ncbi:MAG: hypothetical protein E6J91_01975 [Deltaproteobacteria bacterium]|nr:MAG: hypothetical protein E6J91_01975 [Deltaproteobacteria bacterium]